MTLDEFLVWDSDPFGSAKWQLIDGEPVAMAPARQAHGCIQSELARLLGNHLLAAGLDCRAVTEPGVIPRLHANENFRIPDLAVTCAPPLDTMAMPEPVLLIEIMSASNRAVTRANIWSYTTIPSVQEILVVESNRIEAELLRRQVDGNWPAQPQSIGASGTLDLACIGFSVPLAALYRTTYLAV